MSYIPLLSNGGGIFDHCITKGTQVKIKKGALHPTCSSRLRSRGAASFGNTARYSAVTALSMSQRPPNSDSHHILPGLFNLSRNKLIRRSNPTKTPRREQ
jgi:hypothetical protein